MNRGSSVFESPCDPAGIIVKLLESLRSVPSAPLAFGVDARVPTPIFDTSAPVLSSTLALLSSANFSSAAM